VLPYALVSAAWIHTPTTLALSRVISALLCVPLLPATKLLKPQAYG
jgi:hypothetical protein